MRLTAKERILLHLLSYVTYREAVEVPPELAQDGVAQAAGIELRHLTQYVRPLLHDELVAERTAHVKGGRQRRKVYVLTEKGQVAAFRLRERVRESTIRIRDAAGAREETVAKALEAAGPKVGLLALLRQAEAGTVDLGAMAAGAPTVRIERLTEAPLVEHFVGRRKELDALTAEGEGPRVFVVRGVAGIGKSSVAAKACEALRGRRNLFWHTLRPWDSRTSVLTALGEFLSALGKPGVRSLVAHGEPAQVIECLRDDLPGSQAFLVFDDAHEATPEVLDLFRFLKDVVAATPDVTAVFLTRRALPLYDRRDVAIRGRVREIDLGGLSQEDIAAFLSPGMDVAAANVARRSGGHPLLLQLVRSAVRPVGHQGALRDMHRFLEEEVYGELSEPERLALKTASLYRVPVPRDALHSDPSVSHDVLLSLANRCLLRSVGSDALEAHDTVRAFFVDILTPSEREGLGRFVEQNLRALATQALEEGNPVACIGYLSNALELSEGGSARVTLLETLGDVNEKMGDFPSALTAWKEAIKAAGASEVKARLHRKTASALESRRDAAAARKELDAAWRELGTAISAERGWVDLVASRTALDQEEWDRAREEGQRALEMFERFQDAEGLALALYERGYFEMTAPSGDSRLAERDFERGLELAETLEDPELTARLHTALAHVHAEKLGNEVRALEHMAAAEAVPGAMKDPQTRRSFLMLQAWFHLDIRADFPTAIRYFGEAGDIARQIHFAHSVAISQYGIALATYYGGNIEEAREGFRAYAAEILAQGYPAYALEALCQIAECDLRLGDLEDFRAVGRECGKRELEDGRKARPAHVKLLEAGQAAMRGEEARADEAFREALRLCSSGSMGEDPLLLHLVLFYYGICLRGWGRREDADEQLRRAREELERSHMRSRLTILPEAERELAETLTRAMSGR